jgi:hypothetical protein
MDAVECDDGGELTEYVGCKLDWDKQKGTLKFTQPVLLQSFKDEFGTEGSDMPITPGVPMKALQLGKKESVSGSRRTYYRSGVGKLMHLRRWSRPEMMNAVRDLSRYNTNGSEDHAMSTPNRGLTLSPTGTCDGEVQLILKPRVLDCPRATSYIAVFAFARCPTMWHRRLLPLIRRRTSPYRLLTVRPRNSNCGGLDSRPMLL